MATATPALRAEQQERQASTSQVMNRALRSGLSTHLLVEMWKSPFASLADANHIGKILDRAGTLMDGLGRETRPDVHVYQFNPYGVSGTASSDRAHILIHTWPEKAFAAIDIFAKDHSAAYQVLERMKERLKPGLCNVIELTRGKLLQMEDT
jgi:S-adenosylmethionine decarboxylase